MVYVSQLLGKPVYFQDKPFGTIIDMAIFTNRPQAPVSKFEIKHGKKKLTVSPAAVSYDHGKFTLKTRQIPLLPYDHKDLYLVEDLLDKQVIDINGRRLVRVNDIALDTTGEFKVAGIDVGFFGILRRLGIHTFSQQSSIIPWEYIEAFDYQTGNVQIKLTQNKLSSLHPSEIAQLLEGAGAKERLGIVAALDTKKAARALEETDNETQASILEDLPINRFKEMLNKVRAATLADMIGNLHSDKGGDIENILDEEKAKRVKKLLTFPNDTAGGLMHVTFVAVNGERTVKEVLRVLTEKNKPVETIIVTNGNSRFVGVVKVKNLLFVDQLLFMKDCIDDKQFVLPDVDIEKILKLFAMYNLRALPVVNKEKQPIGQIIIDDLLHLINQEKQQDENI